MQDMGIAPAIQFRLVRRSAAYRSVFDLAEPLVSICTPTYNRGELLVERSIASSLGQTYRNIEVVVVGDGCTDDTEERVRKIGDPRLRFHNLTTRGSYPTEPERRWMVAGADAINHAFAIARGDFITQLDDDDMHTPDRVEKLVAAAQRSRADLIFHPFETEQPDGTWETNDAPWFRLGKVTNGAIFYHRWLLRYPFDKGSILRWNEPGDWNRLRKFRYIGAKIVRHPDAMLRHFRERTQYGR